MGALRRRKHAATARPTGAVLESAPPTRGSLPDDTMERDAARRWIRARTSGPSNRNLTPHTRDGETMVEQTRQQRFVRSLRDWGCVFMLAVWLQSIMASAIASKSSGDGSHGGGFLKTRNDLMKENMAAVWSGFKSEFPGQITEQEDLTADMIILLRNQLAHCFISSGKELALFLPTSSQKHLDRLNRAGWIEVPDDAASDPAMLVLREGDAKWFDRNTSMILNFADNTVLRLTRDHGIDDLAIC